MLESPLSTSLTPVLGGVPDHRLAIGTPGQRNEYRGNTICAKCHKYDRKEDELLHSSVTRGSRAR